MIFVPLHTEQEVSELQAAAAADLHRPLFSTHRVMTEGGELAGSLSLFSLPLFTCWVRSDLTPRQAVDFVREVTDFARSQTDKRVVTLCPPSSPIHKHMHRFHYREHIPLTTMFIQER